MARQNVQRVLNKLLKESERGPESKRVRRLINKRTHYYSLRFKELVSEVYGQIEGTYSISKNLKKLKLNDTQKAIIVNACKNYFNSVRSKMTVSSGKFTVEVLANNSTYFNVKITSPDINDNFDGFIAPNRSDALNTLKKELLEKLQPTFRSDISPRVDNMLQIGHREGFSIAEQRTKGYLKTLEAQINRFKTNLPSGIKYEGTPMYRLEAELKNEDHSLNKVRQTFSIDEIYVSEQGRFSNYKQSIQERMIINSMRGVMKRALMDEDWANFKGSSSPTERIQNNLFETARKRGAKVSGSTKNNVSKRTKASAELKGRAVNTSSSDRISVQAGIDSQSTESINWNKLLPLINTRLPPRVMANMKFPSLVNRTGTFASSAEIVAIETTRQGFPLLVYDYERDPYNVFDRTLGRAPWNTPQRDPSALVDKSVREIVREMAIGRFYTRRA